jgi:hypothetical protein
LHQLREAIGEHVDLLDIDDDSGSARRTVSLRVHVRSVGDLNEVIEALRTRPEVRRVELF